MTQPARIRFKARLLRPDAPGKAASWTFLVLPKGASAKLPTRNQTTVRGTLNGQPFRATLEPDGQRSHWLKVSGKLREAARASAGDIVTLEMTPAAAEAESRIPADLRNALAAAPKARALWSDITPVARRDWIQWITTAKQAETRARRVGNACQMLAGGKRRVCCFDRSGFYSKGFGAPKSAPDARKRKSHA
jgi:translation initiation factor IF-1